MPGNTIPKIDKTPKTTKIKPGQPQSGGLRGRRVRIQKASSITQRPQKQPSNAQDKKKLKWKVVKNGKWVDCPSSKSSKGKEKKKKSPRQQKQFNPESSSSPVSTAPNKPKKGSKSKKATKTLTRMPNASTTKKPSAKSSQRTALPASVTPPTQASSPAATSPTSATSPVSVNQSASHTRPASPPLNVTILDLEKIKTVTVLEIGTATLGKSSEMHLQSSQKPLSSDSAPPIPPLPPPSLEEMPPLVKSVKLLGEQCGFDVEGNNFVVSWNEGGFIKQMSTKDAYTYFYKKKHGENPPNVKQELQKAPIRSVAKSSQLDQIKLIPIKKKKDNTAELSTSLDNTVSLNDVKIIEIKYPVDS